MLVPNMHTTGPHDKSELSEADRLMVICNSCRYCEGLCAVFPAMEMRRSFADGDLRYLSNLCHSCGACYFDCQFAPPHEFSVNVPQALAHVRLESYEEYAWPRVFSKMFAHNGLIISVVTAFCVAIFILAFVGWHDHSVLFSVHTGPGAFYRLMPHNTMAALFGGIFAYAVFAIAMGMRNCWRDMHRSSLSTTTPLSFWQAVKDASRLRYLDGGGKGCVNEDDKPTDSRRFYHHATYYGFLLCFASTTTATLYHYLLGLEAPYPWYDLPVVLGTLGGIGLLVGPIGLLRAKLHREPALMVESQFGMDVAFIAMLFFTSLTGLLLLVLRATPMMGILLAMHLGAVFALFLTMPYGKFVHGAYRFLALVKYANERSQTLRGPAAKT